MADMVTIIEKLMQLALKNPNREEAASAALKVVALLDKFQIPIGANLNIIRDAPAWQPPSQDFMDTVEDILKNKRANPDDDPTGPRPQSAPGGLMIQSNDFVDQQEAWRQRMVDAWRALREARVQLQGEIHRYEQETHNKYTGTGRRW